MKNTLKITLTLAAVTTLATTGLSQKALKKADASFDAKQYYKAVTMYKQVYASAPKDKKALIMFKSGVASQEINDYKLANPISKKQLLVILMILQFI